MVNAFKMADEVLLQGVQGITDLITVPGLINTDFADVKMIMTNAGTAIMGIGCGHRRGACGQRRPCGDHLPLLEASIEGARGILLNIAGGPDLGLFEVNEAAEIIHGVAHPDANIIFGNVIDEAMGDEVRVTVIAAGFDRWEAKSRGGPVHLESTGRDEARSRVLGVGDRPRGHLRRPRRRRARSGRRRVRRALVPSLNRRTAPVLIAGAVHAAWSDAAWGDLRPSIGSEASPGAGLERVATEVTRPAEGRKPGTPGPVDGTGPRVRRAGGRKPVARRRPLRRPRTRGWPPCGPDRRRPGVGDPSVLVARYSPPTAPRSPWAARRGCSAPSTPDGAAWRGASWSTAVAAMRATGATEVVGALGPCIHAGCYEFSEGDLGDLAGAYGLGDGVGAPTAAAGPALDLRASVSAALRAGGATRRRAIDACTACAGGYFSHRARREAGRQAMIVWSDGSAPSRRDPPPVPVRPERRSPGRVEEVNDRIARASAAIRRRSGSWP